MRAGREVSRKPVEIDGIYLKNHGLVTICSL